MNEQQPQERRDRSTGESEQIEHRQQTEQTKQSEHQSVHQMHQQPEKEEQSEPSNAMDEAAVLDQPQQPRFHHIGDHTMIEGGCQFHGAEEMSIGSHVFVRSGAWFNIASEVTGERPKIMIGDGCQFNKGVSISAFNLVIIERFAGIGHNSYISDAGHEYRKVGVPFLYQGIIGGKPTIIGEGVFVGANCIISGGGITIGKGSVIGANSVVTRDIPDYSVAVGSPARVIRMFDTVANDWIKVNSPAETAEVLRRRREQPLLSICIPTFNRAKDLERCLYSIYSQIGDCSLIEVIVSDNASSDGTEEVIRKYGKIHSSLRYWRNESNIGAERNILKLLDEARGIYVKLQGDDDFFVDFSVLSLLNIVQTNMECGLFYINVLDNSLKVEQHEGMAAFVRTTSIASGFISAIILRRDAYNKIADKSRFLDSGFNHLYLQYEILRQQPRFAVIHKAMFSYAYNPPAGYNLADYCIVGYLSILNNYRDAELGEDDIREEKKTMLTHFLLPWYKKIVEERLGTDVSGFEEKFTAYYKDEPYYEEALDWIRSIPLSD
ncbi:2,3,4,5-tetrahydropyridine-2,6-dicarboxylate N-acetyltransferase [Paenibacillus plantiphilus]|uniref:2,3,4,5-tetrahydropyridine-2,6-dicarboxylate N-acetyltransferase n=1 Tax=Paenibacillus plantiphilus TaxID=2905650 RepID=A0ABM9CM64_9BACL|nr:glycosyltransferase [Paenibacillus plantiphilus]CAH1218390.1 2,3,4,5-tetrahydropyridine-2,6-dicarboxylate N-acetyltransferase [Paenibacillus plantiphilus]